jgi:flagellar assembly protein FliH
MSISSSAQTEPADGRAISPFTYGEAGTRAGAMSAKMSIENVITAQECVERETAAREQGKELGRAEAGALLQGQLQSARAAVTRALEEFEKERLRYFRDIEGEVVTLAMSIARKILHREAQIDPLLLSGMVRVILESFEAGTHVVIRVNPSLSAQWRVCLSPMFSAGGQIEITEDASVEQHGCVLETSVGKTRLGPEAQMKEIEQGLLDLLAQRPMGQV